MISNGILIIKRCSSGWRTPALRKINGFQVCAGILYAADVVFRRAAGYGLCELFPICRVGHGDHVGSFGHGLGQVQEVVPEGKALVVVLGHVSVLVVADVLFGVCAGVEPGHATIGVVAAGCEPVGVIG